MDRTLSNLLIFSAGLLTGASVTFAALKKRFEERMDREREAEREFYEKKAKEAAELYDKFEKEMKSMKDEKMDVVMDPSAIHADVSKALTNKLCHGEMHEIEIRNDLVEELGIEEDSVYIITPDEFGENGHETKQLYYYAADETLADDDDNVVDPDETNVGEEVINFFTFIDAENCYVRNNETKTDYEIVRVDGSFASYESEGLYE